MKALTVKRSIYDKTTRGMRIFLKTPRLRLLALNMAVAAASAMVIVNTVVLVQADFGFHSGLPLLRWPSSAWGPWYRPWFSPLLDNMSDRMPMLAGTALLVIGLGSGIFLKDYITLVVLWALLGWAIHFLRHRVVACCAVRQQRKTDRRCLPPSLHCHIHAGW
jgi:hypothetical protein